MSMNTRAKKATKRIAKALLTTRAPKDKYRRTYGERKILAEQIKGLRRAGVLKGTRVPKTLTASSALAIFKKQQYGHE